MSMTTETPPTQPTPRADAEESTGELVREAIDEARELARLEVALARDEAIGELKALKRGAIAFGGAAVAAMLGVALLLVALALVLGGALAAFIIGLVLLAGAAIGAWLGWHALPKKPLPVTRERIEGEVKELKERTA